MVGLLVLLLEECERIDKGQNVAKDRGELHKKGETFPSSCCNID